MRDGTKLAVDILRPSLNGKPVETPLPVIWTHQRYHRESLLPDYLMSLMNYGYIYAVVDARGTGASFGVWQGPASPEETRDAYEITEWFAAQPWCNGKIGMLGRSYLGGTQYMAASTMPPHLTAIFPEMAGMDQYDKIYPGGIFYNDKVASWSESARKLDTFGASVDDDPGGALLAAALQQHTANRDVYQAAFALPYRDSQDPQTGWPAYQVISPLSYLKEIEKSGVAIYHWTGWYDLNADDMLRAFKNLNNPQKIVIGPWSHTGSDNLDLAIEHLRWYDYWLKGIDNGIMAEAPIYYYTLGADSRKGWYSAWQWPLPTEKPANFFFSRGPANSVESTNDGTLSLTPPTESTGRDRYLVDYSTTSGTMTRWDNSAGGSFIYPDMTANDLKGLTYTSTPIDSVLEATGFPVAHLWISSTAKDGDFFVYLEDINEKGYSNYVSEGALRASHRLTSPPPFDNFGLPYQRSFVQDIVDLPDQPAELAVRLLPTSYAFDRGHRIRVTITCGDADNALTPQLSPAPVVTIYWSKAYSSYIALPVNGF
jgi:putative CocE/NonD family hydrolase